MIRLVIIAVGIGLAVNLLMGELLGVIAGGMVVAGYVALNLNAPADVALTLAAAVATLLIVEGLSRFVIIYGRRQFAAMILVGYLVGLGTNLLLSGLVPSASRVDGLRVLPGEAWGIYRTIGFIIPGLIAMWMKRQGFWATTAALLLGAGIVRLVLVVMLGSEVGPVIEIYAGPLMLPAGASP